MARGHLRLGESEGEDAGGDAVILVLLRAVARRRLVPGDTGREGDAGEPAGSEPQPGAQGEDRIEHRAGRPGERATVQGLRVAGPAPATEESHAVGFPLDLRLRRPLDGESVVTDHCRIVRRAQPAPRQQRGALGDPLGLDEELAEGRVGDVLGDRAQTELDVARQLDLARAIAVIGQRDPSHLGIVAGRDGDLEARRDLVVAALEGRLLGEELHQVAVGSLGRGLIGRRPDVSGVDIAQVDELAAGIAGAVRAPACHRAAAAEARAATAVGDDRDIAAVRQDLRPGMGSMRRAQAARRPHRRRWLRTGGFGGMRRDDRRRARDSLLQQQLGRLDSRIGVEPVDHAVAQEDVGDGDERHALVVGHVGLHDDAGAGAGEPGRGLTLLGGLARCVVDGVEVAERAQRARGGEVPQIAHRLGRLEQRGQRRRIGRHDELVGEPALQSQARNAELLVLIVAETVGQVVGRLGDAPRHMALAAVANLLADGHAAALIEERAGVGPHQQQWHEVLEHRRAPRDERRSSSHADDQPSEVEPVALRHVALGDGEEARQARLRGQQVVEGEVGAAGPAGVGQTVADDEELAPGVVEEGEVHAVRERHGAAGDVGEQGGELLSLAARLGAQLAAPRGEREQGPGEVAAVDRGDVARQEGGEALRVVPVQQVPLVALQTLDRSQRPIEALGQGRRRQQAEVVRCKRREEAQAEIGRRGAMGHSRDAIVLDVVRWQPVVLGAGQAFEEVPGLLRHCHEQLTILGLQLASASDRGAAEPVGAGRRSCPGGEKRQRESERSGADCADQGGER